MTRPRLAPLVLAAALGACGPAEPLSVVPFQARFAVRGRWDGERTLVAALAPEGGPLAPADFERAARAALATWERTGCVRVGDATAGAEPNLVISWERGAHGECPPFGTDPSVAHAGPVGPGSFVHLDAGRVWDAASLERALLHEIGHVLGLDHSPDERAVMYHEPGPERARLTRTDLAGIHSLYGGGAPGAGDLVVSGAAGELVLAAVAPAELVGWAPFDTDGDGDAELVTWRRDRAGSGALWCYHFAPGPVLARTLGPLYGLAAPGVEVELLRTAEGARILVLEPERGAAQARLFDARGIPDAPLAEAPGEHGARDAGTGPVSADLDGDGVPETITRR